MDYNRPAVEILHDLIFESNGFRLPKQHTTFGLPEEVDQRMDLELDPNTFIPVELPAIIDDRFVGNTGLMYRRVPITDVPALDEDPIYTPVYPIQIYHVLDRINEKYGLQLTRDDVEDTWYESYTGPYELVIKPTALVWHGRRTIPLVYTGDMMLVTVTDLNGFVEYQAP